jgi:hypothetical protein
LRDKKRQRFWEFFAYFPKLTTHHKQPSDSQEKPQAILFKKIESKSFAKSDLFYYICDSNIATEDEISYTEIEKRIIFEI